MPVEHVAQPELQEPEVDEPAPIEDGLDVHEPFEHRRVGNPVAERDPKRLA